jgi:hypothetical protein
MVLPMSFLSLGSGKMGLDIRWLYHGGRISCDYMVFPEQAFKWNIKTCYMQHTGSK